MSEIEDHADRYPGTKIVELARRTYPGGTLAAHVLGHLGPVEREGTGRSGRDGEPTVSAGRLVGRMGVERQYEAVLRGRHGVAVEQTDHSGHVLTSYRPREPLRRPRRRAHPRRGIATHGGRVAAQRLGAAGDHAGGTPSRPAGPSWSWTFATGRFAPPPRRPRSIPICSSRGKTEELAALLADKSHPLFDRVCRMAIPPGSTFKVLTAVALLESAAIGPQEPFFCQGYLHQPDRQRCEIYVRQGVGHGEVALADALAVSCNVYFFHFAGQMGPRPLVDWAERFGFGRPTGVDLPGEAAGTLPSPENIRQLEGHAWRTADTQSMAIGQGSLTATPLQVLRMMAAVANGGRLVTPHVVGGREQGSGVRFVEPVNRTLNRRFALHPHTLQAIREGLRRVVADPKGTAHATVYLESIAIAGKTGTAETGEDRASHAWFAGYVPADEPKLAFVVVLEHAGDAATAAGPVAKRLVLRMEQLGLL